MLIIQNIINSQASEESSEAVITVIKMERTKNFILKKKETNGEIKKETISKFPLSSVKENAYLSRSLKLFPFLFDTLCTFIALFECKGNRHRSIAYGLPPKCVSVRTRDKIAMMEPPHAHWQ